MKVPTVVCLFAGAQAGLIAKAAQQPFQVPSDIDNQDIGDAIPGNSPFRHCTQFTQKNSIFQMSSLELHPAPPDVYSGDFLYYKLSGTLSSPITKDSVVQVKNCYNGLCGGGTWYFCDQLFPRGKECPPEKGEVVLDMGDWIPWHAPKGNYTKRYMAWTPAGDFIFCFNGTILVNGDPPGHKAGGLQVDR